MTVSKPTVDVVAGLTSRAADHGRVWMVIAALLAAVGRRFGRRSAIRGMLALGAAEAGTAVVKQVARRQRPRRRLGALLDRRTTPRTSSFPSAHAAAGFAFATGAAMELPVLSVPLGAAAGAVAWSRVRTGQHRWGDVTAGAALGVAVAAATRRAWPVAPHEPAGLRTGAASKTLPPGARVAIVVNPDAGPAISTDPEARLHKLLPDAEVLCVDEGSELPKALERASEADVIGVSGGDGTVNRAAHTAHTAGKPLLVVPGGTLNHFAHALGIETFDEAAAAVEGGKVIEADVACVAGAMFLNVASFGVYPELVAMREGLEHRVGKWPALVLALARVLRKAEPVEVEIDGRHRRVWMCFVGNCRYHPSGFAPSWREKLDDGQLDVRIVDAASPFSRTRLVLAVLTGRLGRTRVYEERTATSLDIRSLDGPLTLAVDGEVVDGPAHVTFEKDASPLQVLVPAD
ncbi:MAG: phosphatase PAP2 family protein [Actinobacteria bacterium]|nr:phosphatase PAP2 family protein [Actinomycetota bacterium]